MLTFAPNPVSPVKEKMHHFICASDCLSPAVHKKQKRLYVSATSCKLRRLFTRMSKTPSKTEPLTGMLLIQVFQEYLYKPSTEF